MTQLEDFAPVEWLSVMEHLDNSTGDITADVETILETLLSSKSLTQWIVGDAIHKVGSSKQVKEHYIKLSGETESAISSWMTTCKTWEPLRRWQLVSEYADKYPLKFSMFKELNSIANNNDYGINVAENALRHAGDNSFTVKQLKRYIANEIKGDKPKTRYERIEEYIHEAKEDGYIKSIPLPVPIPVNYGAKLRIRIDEVIEPDDI